MASVLESMSVRISKKLMDLKYFYTLKPGEGLLFTRFSLERTGWFWFVFPRYEIRAVDEINLFKTMSASLGGTVREVNNLALESEKDIRTAVNRSIKDRADRSRISLENSIEQDMFGTKELPSQVLLKGREAAQMIQRSVVEVAGSVAERHFQSSVTKSLAQILAYARAESGSVTKSDKAFPIGTRFFFQNQSRSMYVIEEAPRVRTVFWDNTMIQLSFPYVIFLVNLEHDKFESMQMFLKEESLTDMSDTLYLPALPDIMITRSTERIRNPGLRYVNWVCFPGPNKSVGTPSEIVYSAQQVFWSSEFRTSHWHPSLRNKLNDVGFSIKKWHELSKTDPLAALKIPLCLVSSYTIKKLAESFTQPEEAFGVKKSFTQLERYVYELAPRVSIDIQEAVLEAITDDDGPAEARRCFETKLREVVSDSKIAESFSEILRKETEVVCNDGEIDTIVATIARQTGRKLTEIVMPTIQKIISDTKDEFVLSETGEGD